MMFGPQMSPGFGAGPVGFNPMMAGMMMAQMGQMMMMMQMMMGGQMGMGQFGMPMMMNPAFGDLMGMGMPGMGMPGMGMPGMGMPGMGMPGMGYPMPFPQPFPMGPQGPGAPGCCGCGPMGPVGSYSGPIDVNRLVSVLPRNIQNNARQHFPGILAECQRQGVTDRAQIAYILATACHESNAGGAMTEFASGNAYEGRRSLGNCYSGDGVRFKGRGYVQITGRRNYADWSRRLGVDLVSNPERARDPQVAARILVGGMRDGTFTGRKLGDYVGNGRADFHNARRVVNGTDRAGHIGNIAQRLLSAM